ncbi:DNA-methyltransferase [Photobacterium leiognathi]|uniref:DNA-methyltransferase n=1 Tax=Photobacterium leiognathi TaxID=553611 RepID=UPI001EDE0A58|nr:site-specific DNA-methyltransferase [Photobacterium leiognathi]
MKEIPDGSVDMILCDPPYGTTACKWDSIIPLDPMWEQLKRIIKPNGAIVMTASQPFTTVLAASNLKQFRYDLVYEKSHATGHLNANRMPMRSHENILVFYGKLPTYNPQKTKKAAKNIRKANLKRTNSDCYGSFVSDAKRTDSDNTAFPLSVLKFSNSPTGGDKGLHPTQKPVALMEYLIKTYTNEGETVLDFTCGSGTTGVAAVNLNRKFIGIELDQGYFEIAKERIYNAAKTYPNEAA